MQIDPEYLRQQYRSLSDEALLAVDRSELVETAQRCYDVELEERKLGSQASQIKGGNKPDWLEDAAEVYSRQVVPGTAPAPDVADARDVLEADGIPCHMELVKVPEEKSISRVTHQLRLLVPGNLNLQATSVLERDIFNVEFEAEWRTHLETLSDEELREISPQIAFCGLFDRIERVTRAYADEIARRGLSVESE
jgi:hypothetical protein